MQHQVRSARAIAIAEPWWLKGARALASVFPAFLITWLLALFMASLIAVRDTSPPPPAQPTVTISTGQIDRIKRSRNESTIVLVLGPVEPGTRLTDIIGRPGPPDTSSLNVRPSFSTGGAATLPTEAFALPRGRELDLVTPAFAACFAEGEETATISLRYDIDGDGMPKNITTLNSTNTCVTAYAVCELSTWYEPTSAGAVGREATFVIGWDEQVTRGSACATAAAL
ncbi:MAG: hypothetical protein AAF830_16055 [Pseudomonadota bacterium]